MIEHWPSMRLPGFKSHHWEKKMLRLGNNVNNCQCNPTVNFPKQGLACSVELKQLYYFLFTYFHSVAVSRP